MRLPSVKNHQVVYLKAREMVHSEFGRSSAGGKSHISRREFVRNLTILADKSSTFSWPNFKIYASSSVN
jgi:hypothetical protein